MDPRSNYGGVVAGWRDAGARSIGDSFAEVARYYDAYTWYLVALALGDESAGSRIDLLEIAEVLCTEDTYLVNLQLAIWFARGVYVDVDIDRSLLHLGLVLEFSASKMSFPRGPVNEQTVLTLIDNVIAGHGWPATLDFSLPLGPAKPSGPLWINERHAVARGH
jgi:hypothetical protein